jgi:hypothetical protein
MFSAPVPGAEKRVFNELLTQTCFGTDLNHHAQKALRLSFTLRYFLNDRPD